MSLKIKGLAYIAGKEGRMKRKILAVSLTAAAVMAMTACGTTMNTNPQAHRERLQQKAREEVQAAMNLYCIHGQICSLRKFWMVLKKRLVSK